MDDLISREDALNFKTKIPDLPGDTTMEEANGWSAGVRMYQKYIKGLPPAQPEEAIPLSWIEAKCEWLWDLDNGLSTLSALTIKALVDQWKEEQDG